MKPEDIKNQKGLLLDGIFASEHVDSSGEILDIKGCDISDYEEGKGVANYEHADADNGKEIVGKIVFAKKIFKESDCDDDRQVEYWKKVEVPFIYGVVRLFDETCHPGAVSLAAIIRNNELNKEPVMVQFSIEGSTVVQDEKGTFPRRLKESIAKKVALTLRPCNKSAVSGVLSDTKEPKKKANDDISDIVVGKFEPDGLTKLGGSREFECNPHLTKSSYNVAPTATVNDLAKAKEAMKDWDGKEDIFKFVKSKLTEVSDEFLRHFADSVGKKLKIKKFELLNEELQRFVKGEAPSQPPEPKKEAKPTKVDFEAHGVFKHHHTPQAKAMVHGMDLSVNHGQNRDGISDYAYWSTGGHGKKVFVKPNQHQNEAHHEFAYASIADKFFGLGHYVPNVGMVSHPDHPRGTTSVMDHIDGEHFDYKNPQHVKTFQEMYSNGEMDKLAIMNAAMANSDRHSGNWMMEKHPTDPNKRTMKLIDHGLAFGYFDVMGNKQGPWMGGRRLPEYYENAHIEATGNNNIRDKHKPLHPDAYNWLQSLDPEVFKEHLLSHGIDEQRADEGYRRLDAFKESAKINPDIKHVLGSQFDWRK